MSKLKFVYAYLIVIVMLSTNLFAKQDILKDIKILNKNIKQSEVLKNKFSNLKDNDLSITNSNGVLWVELILYNRQNRAINKEVFFTSPLFEKIDIYYKDNTTLKKYKELTYIDKNFSSHLPHFSVNIKPDETNIYYIHLNSSIKQMKFNIELENRDKFLSNERLKIYRDNIIVGIFISAILLLILLYYILKERNYLYLALSIFVGFYFILFYSGDISFIAPDGLIKLNFNIYTILVNLLFIVYSLHTVKFFRLDGNKKVENIFKGALYLFVLEIIVASFFTVPKVVVAITSILFLFVNLYFAFVGLKGEAKGARFNIISTLILAIFIIVAYYTYIDNSMIIYLTASLFLIFSYLDRAYIKKKKELNMLVSELDKKFIIEQKVEEKQSQLQELEKSVALIKDDINDSVKNHLQTVVSMLKMQQNRLEYSDTADSLKRLELRLSSLVRAYNKILSAKDYKQIDMKSAIESIIVDQLEKYKELDKHLAIITDIDAKLKLYDALYIATGVVDAIANSYKNSDDEKMKITIKQKSDGYDFSIKYKGGNSSKKPLIKRLFS